MFQLPQDSVSEQSERFFVAEIIRENIFKQYHQEIPYCTAVWLLLSTWPLVWQ